MALAAAALRQLRPSAFYFVPGFRTPFKDFRPVPYSARAAMLAAAVMDSGMAGAVRISPFEARQRRVVYSFETVSHFRKLHPGVRVYFLMGSDCLAGFGGWRRGKEILRDAVLLVGRRPGSPIPRGAPPHKLLSGRFPEADSTAIRNSLFLGRGHRQLSRGVTELAEKRALYLFRERSMLRRLLTSRRYEHTILSAELALELAPLAGVPQQKAALAALLHDCARDLPAGKRAALCPADTPLRAEMLREAPVLAHAWAGAELARRKFGIEDPEVLDAIRVHATGAPGMGPLARLLYVSDFANRGRDFREARLVRRLAFIDLDEAFRSANYVKLVYTFSGGGWVHPLSVGLWNSLQEKKSG